MAKLREKAKGRWPEIITALLGEQYANTRKNQPCPKGEGKDRYRFSDIAGGGQFFCACSDGGEDGFALLQCVNGWDFKRAAEAVESIIGETGDREEKPAETWASKLRRETVKTKRSAYLSRRGLTVPPGLDWHKALAYFDGEGKQAGEYPAMLAPVTRGGKFLTYHATYLHEGGKAPVEKPRKILPAHGVLKGGGVALYPPQDGWVGVAEGIETAIAARILFGTPTHAALNTSLLKSWQPPEGVQNVVVYGDNDGNYAGQAAAYALAHRLTGKGYKTVVTLPNHADTDFNDMLAERTAA